MPRAEQATAVRWPAPPGLRERLARPGNRGVMLDVICEDMRPGDVFNNQPAEYWLELRREHEQRRADILAGGPVTFTASQVRQSVWAGVPGVSWNTVLRLDEEGFLTVV